MKIVYLPKKNVPVLASNLPAGTVFHLGNPNHLFLIVDLLGNHGLKSGIGMVRLADNLFEPIVPDETAHVVEAHITAVKED